MHALACMTPAELLRKLIRACVDDGRTLRHESSFVDSARSKALARLASERRRFATDLERLARGEQSHDGSWSELTREALRDLWVAAAGRNNGDAIASCRHSRARTEAVYDEALEVWWPDQIQRVLVAQRRRLHDEAQELNRLQF